MTSPARAVAARQRLPFTKYRRRREDPTCSSRAVRSSLRSTPHINNEHKACLDQIALALDQDPRAALVVDGHRDTTERLGISLTRANNARDYLVSEKSVDPARITIRNFGDTCPFERGEANLNRRVELWVLPQGTTIDDVDAVKRCRPGSSPRVITNEEPAAGTEPSRPQKRRPEPVSDSTEPDARYSVTRERELAPATEVRSVSTSIVNGALRVKVETNGAAQFRDFTLTSPSRIVIDLPGIRSALGSKTLPVVTGLVDRVRVGDPGQGAVRIVIDVRTMPRYRVIRDGAVLIIIIGDETVASGSLGTK